MGLNPDNSKETWGISIGLTLIAFSPILFYWVLREFFSENSLWVFFDHIEILYYVSGIELSDGFIPSNVDNPGTPAQLLSYALIEFLGDDPANYSNFVYASHLSLLFLSLAASIFIIRYATQNLDWYIRISGIWVFFSFSVGLTYLRVFGPEPFYYILGALSLCALFHAARNIRSNRVWTFLLFGASIGALLSVKFTFLAWLPGLCLLSVLAPEKLVSVQSVKNLLASLLGVILAFLLITIPIQDAYPYMFDWVLKNITKDGAYGSGSTSLPSISAAVNNWASFVLSNKPWIALIIIVIGLSIYEILKSKHDPSKKPQMLVISFAVVSILFSILFVMRSYQSRYMLPIGLCGIALFYNYASLARFKHRVFLPVLAFAFLMLMIKAMNAEFTTHELRMTKSESLMKELDLRLDKQIDKNNLINPVIIYGWRLSHPALSLRQHPVKGKYLSDVDRLYPKQGHFTPWSKSKTFRLPSGEDTWDLAIIREDYLSEIKGIDYHVVDSYRNYKILSAHSTSKYSL